MLTVEALPQDSLDRTAHLRRFKFVREDGSWAIRCATYETLADPVSLREWVGRVIAYMRRPNPSAEARADAKWRNMERQTLPGWASNVL